MQLPYSTQYFLKYTVTCKCTYCKIKCNLTFVINCVTLVRFSTLLYIGYCVCTHTHTHTHKHTHMEKFGVSKIVFILKEVKARIKKNN